jgi:endoglucanase
MRVAALPAALLLAVVGMSPTAASARSPMRATGPAVLLRVDQGGYLARQAKFAVLMSRSARPGTTIDVLNAHGTRVATAAASRRASWSTSYPDEYGIDFGGVTRPGRYRLAVAGTSVRSPIFSVVRAPQLWSRVLRLGVRFDQV